MEGRFYLEGGVALTLGAADDVDGAADVAAGVGGGDAVEAQQVAGGAELGVALLEPLDRRRRRFRRHVAGHDHDGAQVDLAARLHRHLSVAEVDTERERQFTCHQMAAKGRKEGRKEGRRTNVGGEEDVELELGLADAAQAVVGGAGVDAVVVQVDAAQRVVEGGGDEAAVAQPAHVADGRLGVHLAAQQRRRALLHAQRRRRHAHSRSIYQPQPKFKKQTQRHNRQFVPQSGVRLG